MRVENADTLAPASQHAARQGLCLRLLHGVQHGVEQVERDDHNNARFGVGALQFPSNAGRVPVDFLGTGLRINPVGLHVPLQADVADGIRVRIDVFQVGTVA